MIIHLPIFNVVVPGNVATMFEMLIPVVMFDVLEAVEISFLYKAYPKEEISRFKTTRIID